jgi:glycosyltransferase involved in cell wall biosynthesis
MTGPGKNVAIFSGGVVGTGEHGQGIPALVDCLFELAKDYDLTVYSLLDADPDGVPAVFRLRKLPFRTPFLHVDLFFLSLMLVLDHARKRYHLIHAISAYPFGWVGVLLGRFLKIPSLVELMGQELANLPEVGFGDLRNKRRSRRITMTCKRADALVALSQYQALGLSRLGVPPDRSVVIPFGIDTSRFPFHERTLNAPYVFLHVSYSVPVKDAQTLLETFRIINERVDSRLIIIGQNHIGQETDSLIRKLSLQAGVEMVGSLPNNQIAEYLRQAHFLLHTSRYESQGVVFNEAMASGVVVCSTRVGLAADLGDDCCVLGEVGDSAGLAGNVISAIGDEARYARMRSNAHQWSVSHDVKWTAAQYRKIYRQFP